MAEIIDTVLVIIEGRDDAAPSPVERDIYELPPDHPIVHQILSYVAEQARISLAMNPEQTRFNF